MIAGTANLLAAMPGSRIVPEAPPRAPTRVAPGVVTVSEGAPIAARQPSDGERVEKERGLADAGPLLCFRTASETLGKEIATPPPRRQCPPALPFAENRTLGSFNSHTYAGGLSLTWEDCEIGYRARPRHQGAGMA